MGNKEIGKILRFTASLLELHQGNEQSIKEYFYAGNQAEGMMQDLAEKTVVELTGLGFSASIAQKIESIVKTKTFAELNDLLSQTPEGVQDMLKIKGLGAKKVRTLWQEAHITDLPLLAHACKTGKLASIKGFGEKTQEQTLKEIDFIQANQYKILLPEAFRYAQYIETVFKECDLVSKFSLVGEMRRYREVIEKIEFLVATSQRPTLKAFLDTVDHISVDKTASGMFVWRGHFDSVKTPLEIYMTNTEKFENELFLHTATPQHLHYQTSQGKTLLDIANEKVYSSETAIYEAAGLPYIIPEMREGLFEFAYINKEKPISELIELSHVKGILHAHSTYSDGRNTLAEMANACIEQGYEYLGITDHSKAAFYANGMLEAAIEKQHQEIDSLNQTYSNFKIFKGVEADILNDGSLDYEEHTLRKFDFVIASVHSVLQMNIEKATHRLLHAIQNPHTTILGHSCGRVLLRREGYPLDYKIIIDACESMGVVIEINANPKRLDLDWRWVRHALDKGVIIAINPDAHRTWEIPFVHYGVKMGRKAGLLAHQTLNTMTTKEIDNFFRLKRSKVQ